MAKIKVFYTEGWSTWIVKDSVEIDTDNYPVLQGMSKEEIAKYISLHAEEMRSSEGDDPDSYSLYDECQNQHDIRHKETGNEVAFQIEETE